MLKRTIKVRRRADNGFLFNLKLKLAILLDKVLEHNHKFNTFPHHKSLHPENIFHHVRYSCKTFARIRVANFRTFRKPLRSCSKPLPSSLRHSNPLAEGWFVDVPC